MELLELALSMELDLKDFYKKQAELHNGNSLKTVFTLLAEEEDEHAAILRSYASQIVIPLTDSNILSDVRTIFKQLANFSSEIKDIPSQLDVYRMALEKEEESKSFYQDLCDKAAEERSKRVFGYLTEQEDKHCIILEELVKRVTRPEEWVESAEFGIREDY